MAKRSADGLFKRGHVWWGWRRLFPGGPLHRASTKCRDRQAARLVKAEWERSAADPIHYASNKTTLAEGIVMFLEDAKNAKLSPDTLEMYDSKCRHIARVLDGARPLRSVVNSTWRTYIKQRESEGASSHTIKKELIRGYGILRVAKEAGKYPHDLSTIMPRYSAGYVPRTRALSMPELLALGRELRADRLAHVSYVVASAARRKESYRARAEHLDVVEWFAFLDGTKTAKAKRWVAIAKPLQSWFLFAVQNAPGTPDGFLFPKWTNARRDIHDACKRAGIAPCTWNDLRRTNATILDHAGVSAKNIAELLGHVDSRMAETVYIQSNKASLRRMLDAAFDNGTETTHSSAPVAREPAKKADGSASELGLRSRRSPVRVGCGAPENTNDSVTAPSNLPAEASVEVPPTAAVQYTNSTVESPDKWDLVAALARVLRRAS